MAEFIVVNCKNYAYFIETLVVYHYILDKRAIFYTVDVVVLLYILINSTVLYSINKFKSSY